MKRSLAQILSASLVAGLLTTSLLAQSPLSGEQPAMPVEPEIDKPSIELTKDADLQAKPVKAEVKKPQQKPSILSLLWPKTNRPAQLHFIDVIELFY